MDDKNIALLGFISKAADYLKDKIDDQSEEIKEVGEVDLDKIKDELSKRLGSSFDGIKDKKDDLISAGREVFDDFISSNSMIDDFKDIFDIDFKEKNEEKDEHIINHLMEMLNETPEEDTNEYEKIITKATSDLDKKEAQDKKELEIYKDSKQDKEIDSLFSEIVAHENGDDIKEADELFTEEKEDTLTSSQIKELVENAVSSAVNDALSKFTEKFASKEDIKEEPEEAIEDFIDDEILEDLSNRQEEVESKKEEYYEPSLDDLLVKDTSGQTSGSHNYKIGEDGVLRFVDDVNETTDEEEPKEFEDFLNSSDLPEDQKQAIKNILSSFGDLEVEEESPFEKTDIEEPVKEEVENPTQDDVFTEEEFETPETEEVVEVEESPIEEEIETPVIEETEVIKEEPTSKQEEETLSLTDQKYFEDVYSKRSLDDLYISNPGAGLIEDEPKEEVLVEETTTKTPLNEEYISEEELPEGEERDFVDDYINDLMNDLSKESPTDKALEEKQKEIDAKNAVYNSIKAIYPYLSDAFIKGVYDLKDTLANEYKENEKIVILHRLRFADLEGLRRFVEVIMSHDYLVNVDEKQMIVDTFKEHINADGVILTDIFGVANQAKLLTGEYDGYRILRNEEETSL